MGRRALTALIHLGQPLTTLLFIEVFVQAFSVSSCIALVLHRFMSGDEVLLHYALTANAVLTLFTTCVHALTLLAVHGVYAYASRSLAIDQLVNNYSLDLWQVVTKLTRSTRRCRRALVWSIVTSGCVVALSLNLGDSWVMFASVTVCWPVFLLVANAAVDVNDFIQIIRENQWSLTNKI